jgi:FkbM family methyltransferase
LRHAEATIGLTANFPPPIIRAMGFSFRRFLLAALSRREAAVTQSEWKRLKFTYAQEGEDIIARALLPEPQGFYVEVGAFHPVSISNTYLFYRQGWRGIVVDPFPHVAELFKQRRPEDIMLSLAVSNEEGERRFDIMKAKETNRLGGNETVAGPDKAPLYSIQVQCCKLSSILDEHLPANRKIDFLTVDTEGHDLSVLQSNNWQKYRPRLVAVEDFAPETQSPVCAFLAKQGYQPVITARMTRFFIAA